MKVLSLPFTKHIGIEPANSTDYLLQLQYSKKVVNHLNTIHASASFALAEITSGYYLNNNFKEIADQTIPILRSSSVKYKKAGQGSIFSTAKFLNTNVKEITNTLHEKRKIQITIQVKLYNEQKEMVMLGDFDWFVTLK